MTEKRKNKEGPGQASEESESNLPAEFLQRMKITLGEEYPAFLASYREPAAQALRRNPGKVGKEEFEAIMPFSLSPVPWSENGYYYAHEDTPGRHPYHEAGLYYMQEPSAQAVAEYLSPKPGEKILDLCAAPGGKSTQIAAAMQGKGLLISNEIHPGRAAILSENVERMGLANVLVLNETPQRLAAAFPTYFDKIAVDAPCSGEGMFRKNEEARREWSPDAVRMCTRRQEEILESAACMLKEGGILCYSTCTFSEEENEDCVERFLQRRPDFRLEKSLRMWPHKIRGEGHFIAILKKQPEGGVAENTERSSEMSTGGDPTRTFGKRRRAGMCGEKPASPRECGAFYEFIRECLQPDALPEGWEKRLLMFGEQLYLMPEGLPALSGLKALRPGLHLGTFLSSDRSGTEKKSRKSGKGGESCDLGKKDGKRRFLPSHALALALNAADARYICPLSADDEKIRQYLAGQALPYEGEKGWYLVTVDGYGIGWGKVSGNVLKNHYPKGLRKPW